MLGLAKMVRVRTVTVALSATVGLSRPNVGANGGCRLGEAPVGQGGTCVGAGTGTPTPPDPNPPTLPVNTSAKCKLEWVRCGGNSHTMCYAELLSCKSTDGLRYMDCLNEANDNYNQCCGFGKGDKTMNRKKTCEPRDGGSATHCKTTHSAAHKTCRRDHYQREENCPIYSDKCEKTGSEKCEADMAKCAAETQLLIPWR